METKIGGGRYINWGNKRHDGAMQVFMDTRVLYCFVDLALKNGRLCVCFFA